MAGHLETCKHLMPVILWKSSVKSEGIVWINRVIHQVGWCSGNALDLHSRDVRFESWLLHWISCLRILVLSPCRQMLG
jgi:hypothetical protein